MADHNLFVDDVAQRQMAEQLGEGLIYSWIFILGLNFTFEPVDMVDLLGFVVSSGEMQKVNIGTFPGNKSKHALNRKGPSIDKIAVEEILIFLCGVAVQFEDVVEIVVLTVDVTADGHLFFIFD